MEFCIDIFANDYIFKKLYQGGNVVNRTTSKILAGILAAVSASAFSACGDNGSTPAGTSETTTTTTAKTEWTGDSIEVTVDEDAINTDVDISGKTLKWLGFYDLNPTNDANERSVEVAIFEDTYGAKIEWMSTNVTSQFDDLANAIIGGTPPDIFIYSDRTFPYDISQGRFQSVDPIIDWEDPMWASMKDTADKFTWNGEHYLAPLCYGFNDYVLLMYNRTRVQEEGLDDPIELYEAGNWDWNAFTDVMKTYVEQGSDRYGICGYWEDSFTYTSGDTLVTYDGSKFSNNLYSGKIERAMGVLEDIRANDLTKKGWFERDVFDNGGETLFYGMGTWAYNAVAKAYPDDVIQIVPFPRDPDQDEDYIAKRIVAYMWVKGSENDDVVKVWFDINRMVNYDPQYTEVTKEKFLQNNKFWTSDTYDFVMGFNDDSKYNFAFDYGYGVSDAMSGDSGYIRTLYTGLKDEKFESWVQGREEYTNIIDSELAAYN